MNFIDRIIPGRGRAVESALTQETDQVLAQPQEPLYRFDDTRPVSEEERLRMSALENSPVSALINQLKQLSLTNPEDVKADDPVPWCPTFYIRDNQFNGIKYDPVTFVGKADGSVVIGYSELGRREAKDPDVVADAYRKARITALSVYTTPHISLNE